MRNPRRLYENDDKTLVLAAPGHRERVQVGTQIVQRREEVIEGDEVKVRLVDVEVPVFGDEPEADWLARSWDAFERLNDAVGRRYLEVDAEDLPARDRACTRAYCHGERHPITSQWRILEGKVVVDTTVPNPDRDAIHRMRDDEATVADPAASVEDKMAAFLRLQGR